jgi:serine/threonine protein phosphatase 1
MTASGGAPPVPPEAPRPPANSRLYAIGDIHGRLDLLRALRRTVARDAARYGGRRTVVYLGDYIDRGPESAQVLDELLRPLPGFRQVFLLGNHEAMLLDFHGDAMAGPVWFRNGGLATLQSYGIEAEEDPDGRWDRAELKRLRSDLRRRLSRPHLDFLRSLKLHFRAGDYLFVHAGIKPGVALADQAREHLLWIREPFLESTQDHGMVVVHGHSIRPAVEICPNRIGVDTGAFESGRLSCVILGRGGVRVLQT